MTSRRLLGYAAVAVSLLAASPAAALDRSAETALLQTVPASIAPAGGTPAWAQTAVTFVRSHDYVRDAALRPNRPLARRAFKRLMARAFGGGYSRTAGKVKAREVDAALVKALGKGAVAKALARRRSPKGWDPRLTRWDGYEIVAREMGLRHDRPTSEERHESSAREPMLGADIAYAVWKAKTGPNYWGADDVAGFRFDNYGGAAQKVVRYAFDQVGAPYVWGGEWMSRTPAGYPYGAQPHGGVDCSGFAWYVLRRDAPGWHPKRRSYSGWSLADRSSAYMAANAPRRIGYGNLKPGDIMLFSSNGSASGVYHAGIYLGRGWMIDSSGSQAGVSLSRVGSGSYWRGQFAWGRRVMR